ncbi:MAG: MFS transporter [Sodalis sp. (in: enterobacteria)]|uniref:MFS transporter n=1 Tax=Sodalis sp. (in: enterobacteria) TaxID=1898979 RepID=UPI0039E3EB0B
MLLIILVAVGQMAQTIYYVPGIPLIARDLMVARGGDTAADVAAYLLCYGGSQLIYGPLSDRVGRRPVVLSGMAIFCLGTMLAMLSQSLSLMTFACGIQGIGTGVGMLFPL